MADGQFDEVPLTSRTHRGRTLRRLPSDTQALPQGCSIPCPPPKPRHFCGSPLQLITDARKSTKRRATSACILSPPAVITQSDLDKVLAEDDIMTPWEPEKYTLVKTLAAAASGEGTVELMSSEEQLGERVAVKRLPFHLVRASAKDFEKDMEDKRERPWMDIAIVKFLNSFHFPYVCELLGVFHGGDQVNIVSSVATQGDLLSWVDDDITEAGEEREAAMRPIVLQMLKAVRWLHDLGIAHRDLSAENVMLTDGNDDGVQVKIIDFGMATLSRTAKQEVRGKRSYQAPEMHCLGKYDTLLVDNFALGVTLYVMGTHYYPWEHTRPGKSRSFEFAYEHGIEKFLQKKKITRSGRPVSEVFSPSFQELICGLLDFDPETRHSLGEECFHPITLEKVKSKSEWYSLEDALSEISTACSSLDTLPDFQDEDDEQSPGQSLPLHSPPLQLKHLQSRSSVWDCEWLEE
mmetsp:Transcript_14217/g.26424  ORF Transcript_14217/g.26424 Transcript_14217/m.26424 type:complete len:463 (-) Transcript_14217:66-1454(-)